jgi:hypothetical protein
MRLLFRNASLLPFPLTVGSLGASSSCAPHPIKALSHKIQFYVCFHDEIDWICIFGPLPALSTAHCFGELEDGEELMWGVSSIACTLFSQSRRAGVKCSGPHECQNAGFSLLPWSISAPFVNIWKDSFVCDFEEFDSLHCEIH